MDNDFAWQVAVSQLLLRLVQVAANVDPTVVTDIDLSPITAMAEQAEQESEEAW